MTTAVPQGDVRVGGVSEEADPGARTLCDAFQATAGRSPEAIAVRDAQTGQSLTWNQYAEQVRRIAGGLAALGVRRGDTVDLMLTNRIEFYPCDTASLHLGATPFSIYNTSSPEQISYLFANAGNDVVVCEQQFLDRIRAAQASTGRPRHIVCVDGGGEGGLSLEQLAARGDPAFDFESSWRAVSPEDVLTLIYTSGTTGPPKGVELTHANMLAQCRAVAQVLPMRAGARITSYLPSAHAADRWSSHYNSIVYGLQIICVADARRIGQVLVEVKPDVWGGVPRVFEKLVAALRSAIEADPDPRRRAGVEKALEVSLQRVRLLDDGRPVPDEMERMHQQLDEQVLARLRERIGLDQAQWIVCGAAPLSRQVHEFLRALGLPVTELFGMSECSCVVTVSDPAQSRIGTVGRALPGVELSLDDDRELLIRGPIVMRGYRRDPGRTTEVLDDEGWLHSGDIAGIDADGYIRIIDRKKELIINTAGKNMSPANIEEQLKSASPLIGQAVCIGDRRPYNVALLVLDPDAAAARALELGLPSDDLRILAADGRVRREIAEAIQSANDQLSRVEQIKRYDVLEAEWLPGGDELTPTMKLKRKPIADKYAARIEALYST